MTKMQVKLARAKLRARRLRNTATTSLIRARLNLLAMMDSDSVIPFFWAYYGWLLIWGVCAALFDLPPAIVNDAMGPFTYNLWVWMHILGTSAGMGGLVLSRWKEYNGLCIQLAGNFTMGGVLLAYEASVVMESWWSRDMYTFVLVAPYVMGAFFLGATCVRKLWLLEKGLSWSRSLLGP
jgi:hypothetical protein